MSEYYYTIDQDKYNVAIEPEWLMNVDIGWRWCKDELPKEAGHYVIRTSKGALRLIPFARAEWQAIILDDEVVQWCRLPEPLKEGEG